MGMKSRKGTFKTIAVLIAIAVGILILVAIFAKVLGVLS